MFYERDFHAYVSVAERRNQAKEAAMRPRSRVGRLRPMSWKDAHCPNVLGQGLVRAPRALQRLRQSSSARQIVLAPRRRHSPRDRERDDRRSGQRVKRLRGHVHIVPLAKPKWSSLVTECVGQIDSAVDLLRGKLSDSVMDTLCRPDAGLFPLSNEVKLTCSCPDGAWLCKHLAAVLYGIGSRLDLEPELLFVLRGVDQLDLIGGAATGGIARAKKPKQAIQEEELADIFGIELEPTARAASPKPKPKPARRKRQTGRSHR